MNLPHIQNISIPTPKVPKYKPHYYDLHHQSLVNIVNNLLQGIFCNKEMKQDFFLLKLKTILISKGFTILFTCPGFLSSMNSSLFPNVQMIYKSFKIFTGIKTGPSREEKFLLRIQVRFLTTSCNFS